MTRFGFSFIPHAIEGFGLFVTPLALALRQVMSESNGMSVNGAMD